MMAIRISHANGTTPIMDNKRMLFNTKMVENTLKIVDMILKTIWIVLRLIGETATKMIWNNHPVSITKKKYKVPVIKRPGGIAMKHDNDGATPLIDTGYPVPTDIDLFGLKGIQFFK